MKKIALLALAAGSVALAPLAHADGGFVPGNYTFQGNNDRNASGSNGSGTPEVVAWTVTECGPGCLTTGKAQFQQQGSTWVTTGTAQLTCKDGVQHPMATITTINADLTGTYAAASDPNPCDGHTTPETFVLIPR